MQEKGKEADGQSPLRVISRRTSEGDDHRDKNNWTAAEAQTIIVKMSRRFNNIYTLLYPCLPPQGSVPSVLLIMHFLWKYYYRSRSEKYVYLSQLSQTKKKYQLISMVNKVRGYLFHHSPRKLGVVSSCERR